MVIKLGHLPNDMVDSPLVASKTGKKSKMFLFKPLHQTEM